jgi:hypothetical protein
MSKVDMMAGTITGVSTQPQYKNKKIEFIEGKWILYSWDDNSIENKRSYSAMHYCSKTGLGYEEAIEEDIEGKDLKRLVCSKCKQEVPKNYQSIISLGNLNI